jgi:ParB family chromosome partitioning protein
MDLINKTGHRVQAVATDEIVPNPFQPRREFDVDALNELIQSLRQHGLMQPIVVRKNDTGFELVAGERRWRASRELGWKEIEAVVIEANDQCMLEWALVENIQRQNLGPLELATAFKHLADDFSLTQEEVGKAVGMSRPAVANLLRLLDLPQSIQERVSRGTVSMGAARALLSVKDSRRQEQIAKQIEDENISVREVEELARTASSPSAKKRASPTAPMDPNQASLEKELQQLLGTKVSLPGSLQRGRVVIHYHTARELDRLVRRLRGEAPRFAGPDEDESETLTV